MVETCDTGFVAIGTAIAAIESVFSGFDQTCSWTSRPSTVVLKLLRYLPLLNVKTVEATTSYTRDLNLLSARPPDGAQFISQISTLAQMLSTSAQSTQRKLQSLPIRSYLQVLESERDRRVFKGLISQLTSSSFVCETFGWKASSIAKIQEDLSLVDCHLASVNSMLTSIRYLSTPSLAVRKRMRRDQMAKLALSGFLGRKRGGAPSKRLELS